MWHGFIHALQLTINGTIMLKVFWSGPEDSGHVMLACACCPHVHAIFSKKCRMDYLPTLVDAAASTLNCEDLNTSRIGKKKKFYKLDGTVLPVLLYHVLFDILVVCSSVKMR